MNIVDSMTRNATKYQNWRINLILLVAVLIAAAIIFRLFSIQVASGNYYSALAKGQYKFYEKLIPKRGEIFLQGKNTENTDQNLLSGNLFPVATNKDWPMVYAIPQKILNKEDVIEKLSKILELDREVLAQKINKPDDPYEPIAHKISDEQFRKIKELNLEGIETRNEYLRFYPSNNFASHVIGFLGFEGDGHVGQYGVEEYYDEELQGEEGSREGEVDARGRITSLVRGLLNPSRDGTDLILTIDYNIQFIAEKYLGEVTEKWGAERGTVIVAEPSTGKILAIANTPAFNLNEYAKVEDINLFLNPAIHNVFEPGSVFKLITMATALNEGLISPSTTYFDEGYVKIGGYTIHNFDGKSHGVQTMTQVLEKSLNTGALFVQEKIGKDLFQEYVKGFGFGEKTGIDLMGETAGSISNLDSGRDINFATASFGQGIAVTPIEFITAISAIANDGKMMKPYIVERLVYPDGSEKNIEPGMIREVISSQTASRLSAMMVSVVKNGFDKAQVPGYLVAAKTGTAQIPNEDRRGYSDKTIHSIVGFAPAFDPKFVILIKMDNPKGIRFAADSLSPTFKKIAQYILNYYEISPDQP